MELKQSTLKCIQCSTDSTSYSVSAHLRIKGSSHKALVEICDHSTSARFASAASAQMSCYVTQRSSSFIIVQEWKMSGPDEPVKSSSMRGKEGECACASVSDSLPCVTQSHAFLTHVWLERESALKGNIWYLISAHTPTSHYAVRPKAQINDMFEVSNFNVTLTYTCTSMGF